jgi:hypothetical protein
MAASSTGTSSLFLQYLNVCNQALDAHADEFPYRQLVQAAERLAADRRFGVAVYKTERDAPYDFYTVTMTEGRFELLSHGKEEPDLTWKVSQDYLKKVVDDPDTYIQHPAKLDWDWLKSTLGVRG